MKQNHAFLFIIKYLFKLTRMPQSNSYRLKSRVNPSLKMNQVQINTGQVVFDKYLEKGFKIVSERCIPLISA